MAVWNPQANDIFLMALETSSAEARRVLVAKACAGNAELRAQVEALLKASEQAGSFLKAPATGLAATTDQPVPKVPGAVSGPSRLGQESGDGGPPPPPSVAGYVIESVLGHGGMGVVYKAQHLALKRTVALKMVLAGGHASAHQMARFQCEAEAVARLQHPNIVQIHEVGTADGHPYCALEFVEGGSLAQKLAGQPLPLRAAARLVESLARAMQLAHSRNVVHRDLKPANVLLTADGTPKVTDFGLARQLDSDSGETQAGAIMGTPSYMAPEQAAGRTHEAGPAADVYALGAILYECLAGRPPFKGQTVGETLQQVRTQEPAPLARWQPKVPADLETICLKCLRKEPEQRYASAAELADELERFLQGEPILARPLGRVERAAKWARRHKGLSAGLTAAVLALLLGTAVAWWKAVAAGIAADNEARQRQVAEDEKAAADAARKTADDEKEAANAARKTADDEKNQAKAARKTAEQQRDRAELLVYASKLAQAQLVFPESTSQALTLLEECQENLRNWEHRYLWTRFNSRQTLLGHTAPVLSVCFSPDGKRLASASGDLSNPDHPPEVKVWDAQTGQEILALKGHTGSVWTVCFSPDGKQLASAGSDRVVRIWNAATGQEVRALQGHADTVFCVCFSPDGKRLASASGDGTVAVWDAETGQKVRILEGHTHAVLGVCFSPDGKQLASASFDQTVKVWEVKTGQEVRTLLGHTSIVRSVSFSPDGKRLASASYDQTVKVWDTETGREVRSLTGHTARIHSVRFSPDGQRLVSASDDQTVRVWDAETGQAVFILKGHTNWVWSAAFSPNGKTLASAGYDRTVKLWDARQGQEVRVLKGHTGSVWSVCFSSDGKKIASASQDRTVKIWDAASGQELVTLTGHTTAVSSICFSPDGKRLLSSAGMTPTSAPIRPKDPPHVWDATTGQLLFTLKGHTGPVDCVTWSPDGKRLASAGVDRMLKVWDAETGQEIRTHQGSGTVTSSVNFSPDGTKIAAAYDRTVTVWDAATGQELRTLQGPTDAFSGVCFSPDGKRIAAATGIKVKVWDTETGQEVFTVKGNGCWSVCFSRDSTRLAGGGISTITIWDAETGQEVLALKTHKNGITSLCFSPDGQRLAAAGYDQGVQLWETDTVPRRHH